MRVLLLVFLIFSLHANTLKPDAFSNKSLAILNSFDIDTAFLNDQALIELYKHYLKNRKTFFLNVLENGYSYIPLIREKINRADVPKDLIFVAMAESYFMIDAESHKKAVGLWQFMPYTAKKYDLDIDDYIDERNDPVKSTIAAIDYLSDLYSKLNKWYLAIMAYNCGEARLYEAFARAGLDNYCEEVGYKQCRKEKRIKEYRNVIKAYQKGRAKFSKLYKTYREVMKFSEVSFFDLMKVQNRLERQYLPKETRNYIRKIVAMSFLLNSDDFIHHTNSYLLNRGSASSLAKVNVPGSTSIEYLADLLGVSVNLLRSFNKHLNYNFTPPSRECEVYIPYQKLALFKENFSPKKAKKSNIIYRVKSGDSLYKIAKKFKISYKVIKEVNKLKSSIIRPKQKLLIPLYKHTKLRISY